MPAAPAAPVQPKNAEQEKLFDRIPPAYLGENNLQEIEINLDTLVEKVESMQQELGVIAPVLPQYAGGQVVPQGNPERVGWLSEEVELEEESLTEETTADPQLSSTLAAKQKAAGKAQEEVGIAQAAVTNNQATKQKEADRKPLTVAEELEEEGYDLDEDLTLDMQNVVPGGIQGSPAELRAQINVSKALEAQNDELRETLSAREAELEELHEKLNGLVGKLQETKNKFKKSVELNVELKDAAQALTENLNKVNLLNARLLYTNKVLGNGSLNERQKQRIAESISSASTVEEAKTIYNTLQRTAGATAERKAGPQSLTEAISRSPSPFIPRNTQLQESAESIRWKKIAGIIK
jgi:hypothetical protein